MKAIFALAEFLLGLWIFIYATLWVASIPGWLGKPHRWFAKKTKEFGKWLWGRLWAATKAIWKFFSHCIALTFKNSEAGLGGIIIFLLVLYMAFVFHTGTLWP